MFQKPVAAEPAAAPSAAQLPLVALSVLALDLDVPPGGWAAFLTGRGIEILTDDLGREAIARVDARRLFDEKRENEVRKARMFEAAELRAIEQDQQFRAQLFHGIPAGLIPAELTPAAAMLTAAQAARPRRVSPLEEALSNQGTVFHPIHSAPEE
jgi:hypothetical protein